LTKLKEIRKGAGLTQSQLSEISGVPKVSIVRYESGIVTPGGKNLILLAKALKCSAEELLKKAG
jgi:transcriptional regulator with XRE-family HTH domain